MYRLLGKRGGAVRSAREPHKLKVAGSNPVPASEEPDSKSYTRYPPHPPHRRNLWFLLVLIVVSIAGYFWTKYIG